MAVVDKVLAQYPEEFGAGVLNPEVHADLVVELDNVCEIAGVRRKHVINSMKGICSAEEMEWVRRFPQHRENECAGLAYVGASQIQERMSALCGALVRNFIDARIVTVQSLIDMKDPPPDPTVLIVPNFFIGKSGGGDLATWHTTALLGVLIQRLNHSRLTVVGISDMNAMALQYGHTFREIIEAYYTQVS